jgi:uncharacterized membrane protein
MTVLFIILIIAVISILLVIGVYIYFFKSHSIDIDPAPWGQMGDFFGGTLNPIFGFLSVMALLAALVVQGRELKISSDELKNSALALNAQNKAISHQSFEQTFFSWLENYRKMMDSLTIKQQFPDAVIRDYFGKEALYKWWNSRLSMEQVIKEVDKNNPGQQIMVDFDNNSGSAFLFVVKNMPDLITNNSLDIWEKLYLMNEYQLDSLFRNLYRLLLWIDSQNSERMNIAQKWFYISIVRAQLSWIEMVYLFYNGLTERGSNFVRIIDKYALFDNLTFTTEPVILHILNNPPTEIAYAKTAFSSRLARAKLSLPESTEEALAMAAI